MREAVRGEKNNRVFIDITLAIRVTHSLGVLQLPVGGEGGGGVPRRFLLLKRDDVCEES